MRKNNIKKKRVNQLLSTKHNTNSDPQEVEIHTVRKKRGVAKSTVLICPPTSPIPSVEIQKKFIENPITWLGENSVSTLGIDFYKSRTKVDLINGGVYPFSLTEVGIDKYVLSTNPQDVNGIQGYWLSTNNKITIDPHNGPRFIFTGELQGCSIHIKYDKATNKMEVFHRNREHLDRIFFDAAGKPIDGNGRPISELAGVEQLLDKYGNPIEAIPNGSLSLNDGLLGKDGQPITRINGINIEELLNKNLAKGTDELTQFLDYDLKGGTTVGWEEYAVGLPENYDAISAANPGPRINTTPFLYRQDNGKWVFISQQIKYSGSGVHPIATKPGQMFNFELTGKTITKEIEGIPLPPRVRKKRSAPTNPCIITLKDGEKFNIDNVKLSDLSLDKIRKIDGDMLLDYLRKESKFIKHQLLGIISQAMKAGVPVIASESSNKLISLFIAEKESEEKDTKKKEEEERGDKELEKEVEEESEKKEEEERGDNELEKEVEEESDQKPEKEPKTMINRNMFDCQFDIIGNNFEKQGKNIRDVFTGEKNLGDGIKDFFKNVGDGIKDTFENISGEGCKESDLALRQLNSIENNSKGIDRNYNAIRDNYAEIKHVSSQIDTNFDAIERNAEAIDNNYNSILENYDAIKENYGAIKKVAKKADRNFRGIENSLKAIDRNYDGIQQVSGQVDRNFDGIRENYGAIKENYGAIKENYGAIQRVSGQIDRNFDGIKQNYDAIKGNYGAIRENYGAIQRVSGQVDRNLDAIQTNLEAIGTNYNAIKDVSGRTDRNYDAIRNNLEAIGTNYHAIKENYGAIKQNYGAIKYVSGQVDRNFDAIRQNYDGIKENYGAIKQNYAEIKLVSSKVDRNFGAIQQVSTQVDRNFKGIERNFGLLQINNGLIRVVDGKVDRNYGAIQEVSAKSDRNFEGIERNFGELKVTQGLVRIVDGKVDRNYGAILQVSDKVDRNFEGIERNFGELKVTQGLIRVVGGKVDRNYGAIQWEGR